MMTPPPSDPRPTVGIVFPVIQAPPHQFAAHHTLLPLTGDAWPDSPTAAWDLQALRHDAEPTPARGVAPHGTLTRYWIHTTARVYDTDGAELPYRFYAKVWNERSMIIGVGRPRLTEWVDIYSEYRIYSDTATTPRELLDEAIHLLDHTASPITEVPHDIHTTEEGLWPLPGSPHRR